MQIDSKSPYLKPSRLADILALIQSMGLNERYRQETKEWAFIAFGEPEREAAVREVFREHHEFFRDSPSLKDQFSLVARRTLPRRWDTRTKALIGEEAYAALDKGTRDTKITRPRLDAEQINKLMDVAVTLYDAAFERQRDRRWIVAAILPGAAAFIGTVLGAVLNIS